MRQKTDTDQGVPKWMYAIPMVAVVAIAIAAWLIVNRSREKRADAVAPVKPSGAAVVSPPVSSPDSPPPEAKQPTVQAEHLIAQPASLSPQPGAMRVPIAPLPPRTASPVIGGLDRDVEARRLPIVGRFVGHAAETNVSNVSFSSDGTLLLTGGFDAMVILWDVATQRRIQSFGKPEGALYGGCAISPDARLIATAPYLWRNESQHVMLWDAKTAREIRRIGPLAEIVGGIAFSPDGRQLLICEGGGVVRLWNVATGDEVRRFAGHGAGMMRGVAFSPDGRLIGSGGSDKTMRIYDAATGRELHRFALDQRCESIRFHPSGTLVAAGNQGFIVPIFDLVRGDEAYRLRTQAIRPVFTPDGGRVLTPMHGYFGIWDLASAEILFFYQEQPDGISGVAISPDGRLAAFGDFDGHVSTWRLPD